MEAIEDTAHSENLYIQNPGIVPLEYGKRLPRKSLKMPYTVEI